LKFYVYYGHDPALIGRLRAAELLILEPEGWSDEQLRALRSEGAKIIGYISPLAWADWKGPVKWWWGPKERDEAWNAWWLSLGSPGWRYQFKKMCTGVLSRTDGLFLDNLDRLEQDRASLKPLRNLLLGLRKAWPQAYFVGNRGFAHLAGLKGGLDGVLFENLTDQAFSPNDRAWVREKLLGLQGTAVFALDYQTRCDPEEALRLRQRFPAMHYYLAPDETLQGISALTE